MLRQQEFATSDMNQDTPKSTQDIQGQIRAVAATPEKNILRTENKRGT
jgi:hypothetical protein